MDFHIPWKKAEAQAPRTELGIPWAGPSFPEKEHSVSERTTTWCKNIQGLCFLWEVIVS